MEPGIFSFPRPIENKGIVNVQDFDIKPGTGDLGPKLNALIQRLPAKTAFYFPSSTKTYLFNTAVAVNKESYFIGQYPTFTTTNNISMFSVTGAGRESRFHFINFTGQGKATASRTAQFGINVTGAGFTTTSMCTFKDWPGGGFYFATTNASTYSGGVLSDCIFKDNIIAINSAALGEYFAISNCSVTQCDNGIRLIGGNNIVSNCNFNYCVTGLELLSGSNNAHGVVSNCNFNHCTTYGINIHDFTVGQTFANCHSFQSPMRVVDCTGAVFVDCRLDCSAYTLTNAVATVFDGCHFSVGYSNTYSPTGTTDVAFINCFNIDGRAAISPVTFTNTYSKDFVYGTVNTTNATPSNNILSALKANTAAMWELSVVAKITAGTPNDMKCWKQVAATNMTAAASGAIVGAVADVITPIASASMATATSTMDVNSDNLRAVFTGIAATNITWQYKLIPLVN